MNIYSAINFIGAWKPIVEIAILWFVIYHIMLFFEGTRAIQVLRGIIIIVVAFFIIQLFGLEQLDWLLTKFFGISIIAILVIFHPEIRRGLAHLGQRRLFATALREEELDQVLKEINKAVSELSKDKTGALIAIEKNDSLKPYVEGAVLIDGIVSSDLIQNIFTPNTLLHDGGTIIEHDRIAAAGCIFPLSQKQDLSRVFGTRHRAAIGLTEETDAAVIIVSEERGEISLVYQGEFIHGLNADNLTDKIKEILKSKTNE